MSEGNGRLLASQTLYLAVTSDFMAPDDDEHGKEYVLIPVAVHVIVLHYMFSSRKSELRFLKNTVVSKVDYRPSVNLCVSDPVFCETEREMTHFLFLTVSSPRMYSHHAHTCNGNFLSSQKQTCPIVASVF